MIYNWVSNVFNLCSLTIIYFYNTLSIYLVDPIVISLREQLWLQEHNEWNYLYGSLGWFLLFFTIWCMGEDVRDPELAKIRHQLFYNFEQKIIDTDKKINKIKNLINRPEINKSDKDDISLYSSSIQFDIEVINEVYNYRNFKKFINIIEERFDKVNTLLDWVEKEIYVSRLEKKIKVIEEFNDPLYKINYYNPSDFKWDVWNDTYMCILEKLYIVFYIFLSIDIFIIISFSICYFFFW